MPRLLICLLLLTSLAGCFGPRRDDPETLALRQTIMMEALGQIGRPYRYGGTGPQGFDCSGLTQYVYAQAGLRIPRSAREQLAAGDKIDLDDAQAGDLLFYRFGGRGSIDHVAVYLGDGRAVHAPASGRSVIVARVDDPSWQKRFRSAARLID